MSIIVVRHGETDGNALGVVQLPTMPLNEQGLRQAQLVGRRLRSAGVTRILASDLARARMTARAVSDATGLSVQESSLLQERNFGDLRGTPYSELGRDIFEPDYEPPNGESWPVFDRRVAEAWALVTETRQGMEGNLLVVTHGLVLRSMAEHHLTMPSGVTAPSRWGNTSVTVVDPLPPHQVHTLDDTTHLEAGAADGGGVSGI